MVTLHLREQLLRVWVIVPVNLADNSGEDNQCVMKLDIFNANLSMQCATYCMNTEQTVFRHTCANGNCVKNDLLYKITQILKIKADL